MTEKLKHLGVWALCLWLGAEITTLFLLPWYSLGGLVLAVVFAAIIKRVIQRLYDGHQARFRQLSALTGRKVRSKRKGK